MSAVFFPTVRPSKLFSPHFTAPRRRAGVATAPSTSTSSPPPLFISLAGSVLGTLVHGAVSRVPTRTARSLVSSSHQVSGSKRPRSLSPTGWCLWSPLLPNATAGPMFTVSILSWIFIGSAGPSREDRPGALRPLWYLYPGSCALLSSVPPPSWACLAILLVVAQHVRVFLAPLRFSVGRLDLDRPCFAGLPAIPCG